MMIRPNNSRPSLGTSKTSVSDQVASVASPKNDAESPAEALDSGLDIRALESLRKKAGVKKTSWLKRAGQSVVNFFNGVSLALAIGPAVGHLIIAKELGSISSDYFGGEPQAPSDRLREKNPKTYIKSVGSLYNTASAPVEQALGLNLQDLQEVESHYYKVLAPSKGDNGIKSTAPFVRELAKGPFRSESDPRAAFVFLGDELTEDANSVTDLWNAEKRPEVNPFPKEDQRSIIWNTLEKMDKAGNLPVFVDLDGDYSTFTGTESVAKTTLASLGRRNNSVGGFGDTGRYFAWLTARQESYSGKLAPYFWKTNSEAAAILVDTKTKMTPEWLGGKHGMGPLSGIKEIRAAATDLAKIRKAHGDETFIDSLVSLDRDVLTGVQTHWVKLLRESPRKQRAELLKPLTSLTLDWNLRSPEEAGFENVAPAGAPTLKEFDVKSESPSYRELPYDRALGMQDVLKHSLDGLGIAERRALLADFKSGLKSRKGAFEQRETQLQEALGGQYRPVDITALLKGGADSDGLAESVAQLEAIAGSQPKSELGQVARRHASLVSFVANLDDRYGAVENIAKRIEGDFTKHPLGVSEFFVPPPAGAEITPVKKPQIVSVTQGNSNDAQPLKVSQVFEGGGGRGFAFVECIKQLENGFQASNHGYEIDEFVGTSAGSIVAVLLAAGFEPAEVRGEMEKINFKDFNADAVWLMGGVDPKVRGVERNGLFTTQKMYQTFQKLLADKLGVKGRPVVFSDLPHRLKLVSTLVNTDLAADDPLRDKLDGDGRFQFSTDHTPNFDVAAALSCSSSVPAFFQLPQIMVAKEDESGDFSTNRIQFTDGGVVDNLSISSAEDKEDKRSLMILPAHTRTRHPLTGEWVGLDTLNFSTENLDYVDKHNQKLYSKFVPKLDGYFQKAKASGVERVVLAFNLAKPHQQALPAIQGSSEELSLRGLIDAKELGLPVLSREAGDKIVKTALRPPSLLTNVAAEMFDRYLDNRPGEGDGTGDFHRDADGFHYHPSDTEENDLFDMGRASAAAALSAGTTEYANRQFEKK